MGILKIRLTFIFYFFRVYHIPKQVLGYCGKKCASGIDCPNDPPLKNPSCLSNQRCKELKWCPDVTSVKEVLVVEGNLIYLNFQ
jgi:hypothetical protein